MDGRSVVSPYQAAKLILADESLDHLHIIKSDDTHLYKKRYGNVMEFDEDIKCPVPASHRHTIDDWDELVEIILLSERWDELPESEARLYEELNYFSKTDNILFLLELHYLIERFKQENVVWGVGRGSASASFVCFLLEIHDVNPLKYDIPFSEMSKTQEALKYE